MKVGFHFLLLRISLTQGSNSCLLYWQADSLPLSLQGNPHIQSYDSYPLARFSTLSKNSPFPCGPKIHPLAKHQKIFNPQMLLKHPIEMPMPERIWKKMKANFLLHDGSDTD